MPSRTGHVLDRQAAAATIVRALASLKREPVGLPIEVDTTEGEGERPQGSAGAGTRRAVRPRVHLTLGATRWNLRPPRIARILQLPADGRSELQVGGAGASAWFTALAKRVDRPADGCRLGDQLKSGIRVIPDRPGLRARRSAQRTTPCCWPHSSPSPTLRSAKLIVERSDADRTTAEAKAMNIKGLVASYQTFYGGEANRIHNVQLVVAPGRQARDRTR